MLWSSYPQVIHRLSTGYPQGYPQAVLCINPHRPRKGVEYGCGQCRTCRVNRARTWTGRILLEASCYAESAFCTLTYAPEHLPVDGLSNAHWRSMTLGLKCRYFGVGEYGDRFGRPHYHVIAFGVSPQLFQAHLVSLWPYGQVQVLPFLPGAAGYLARYTTKKYLVPKSFEGNPEFQRMSRRPAIGAPALPALKDWLTSYAGAVFLSRNGDVPNALRVAGATYPLGRTLVLQLRDAAGLPSSLPDLQERRRVDRVLALEDPAFRSALENRRVRHYEFATGRALTRRGVH